MTQRTTIWSFSTKQFNIRLEIVPETLDPTDCFGSQEDIDAVCNGEVEWFTAIVRVFKNGHEIGRDVLGACAYRTIEEFYSAHRGSDPMDRNCFAMRQTRGDNVVICHYFPDMVRVAIADARATLN